MLWVETALGLCTFFFIFLKVDTVSRDLAFFKPLADTSTNCRCKCAKNGCVITENLDKNG